MVSFLYLAVGFPSKITPIIVDIETCKERTVNKNNGRALTLYRHKNGVLFCNVAIISCNRK